MYHNRCTSDLQNHSHGVTQVIEKTSIILWQVVHSKLRSFKLVATTVHTWYLRSFVVLTWMRDKRELVLESHKVQHCNMTIITMMTTWCVRVCGLNSLVVYFNVRTRDFGEGKVTAGSEIWTENIHSLESTRRKKKKEKRSMHRIWVVTWHYHHLRKNKVRFQKNSSMFLHWPTKNFIAHKILYSEGDDCLSEWVWGRKKFELHTYPQRCRLPHSRYVLLV